MTGQIPGFSDDQGDLVLADEWVEAPEGDDAVRHVGVATGARTGR